ncbi:MAG TPA: hypothetical protein DCF43_11875 [Pseudomonas sp.]|nr:hypothetical protein [Pseudomonas sp.]
MGALLCIVLALSESVMSSNVFYQAAQLKVDKVILELGFVQPTKSRCIAFITSRLFLVMMRFILGFLTVAYFLY